MITTLINANGKTIRHEGKVFRIIATNLGGRTLAQAEPVGNGGEPINLMTTKSKLGRDIRSRVELGLVS